MLIWGRVARTCKETLAAQFRFDDAEMMVAGPLSPEAKPPMYPYEGLMVSIRWRLEYLKRCFGGAGLCLGLGKNQQTRVSWNERLGLNFFQNGAVGNLQHTGSLCCQIQLQI